MLDFYFIHLGSCSRNGNFLVNHTFAGVELHYNINRSQLDRLRRNKNVQVNTIDRLCNILHCRVEDIMEHFDDDNAF